MKGFQEWGVMADWNKAWKTMDKDFEIQQLRVFQEMVKKGLIFRRYKPVYWSPSSRTALAEAELEYNEDHRSTAAYIKFKITNPSHALAAQLPQGDVYAVIWTTTPWTLPANRAIAIMSSLEYSVVRHGKDLLVIAKSRLEQLSSILFGDDAYEIVVDTITGKDLEGSQYVNILRGREAPLQPIVHADYVTADSGSGLVHIAPGHGADDYELCVSLGIPASAPVDDHGCFTDEALPGDPSVLKGIPVLDGGSGKVLDLLGDKVLATHKYRHKYPYDWRTKLPIILRATAQWFADVGSVKEPALEATSDVRFIPAAGRARLESFVKGRSEWCVSRQRAWGVPIPALYNEAGESVLTEKSIDHIISVIQERGIDAWWTDAPDEVAWVPQGLSGTYTRGKDTMDVWFDSGTSWSQTEGQADLYLEGTDQHRGWFQSSLLTHISASGSRLSPFKTLITHGFTLDQHGKKMSKSVGNTIVPTQIIDGSLLPPAKSKKKGGGALQALGPDALRLWVASSDYTRDVVIGQSVLQFNHTALTKYRIIFKMLLGSMQPSARNAPLTKLDQVALAQLEAVMVEVATANDNFEFYKGVNALNKWINTDLSAFYLEALKDRLYCGDSGGVVEEIFNGLLSMLAPITPHLVEEVWEHRPEWLKSENHVHPLRRTLNDPIISPSRFSIDQNMLGDFPWLMSANAAIKTAQEEARVAKRIGSSLESSVVLELPEEARSIFSRYEDELEAIFVVSDVALGGDHEGEWAYSAVFEVPGGVGKAWVLPPKEHKCPRCWRYVAPVEDELCKRCDDIVSVQNV